MGEDFNYLSLSQQDEMLKRGEYFLWLYPRTEYYFMKHRRTNTRDFAKESAVRASAEPDVPLFIGNGERQEEARELYKAQFTEANDLLHSASIQQLTQSIHTTDINTILPLTSTLKRWAMASAKILLTKPFEHGWSLEVENEVYGWEIGERRTPMAFGLSLPYTICKDLPRVFENKDIGEAFKEALARNAEYLNSLKMSTRGFTAKQEQRLLMAKQKLDKGLQRVLCF